MKATGRASLRAALKALNRPKRNKFGAKKAVIDGITFASLKEAAHYQTLTKLARAGQIRGLVCHKPFELVVNGTRIGKYTPDFYYEEFEDVAWGPVADEVKGGRATKTEAYRLRVKLFKALYPQYTFRET